MTLSLRLLMAYLALICSLALPAISSATSASISVSGNEGVITVSAAAYFSTHIFCSGSGDDEKCWPVNSGTMRVYRNTSHLASKSGEGFTKWSDEFNAGMMSQGLHAFRASARDSKGITDTSTKSITIDNTPVLTAQVKDFEGDMEIEGTVDFKENPAGAEGRIEIWLSRPNSTAVVYRHGTKYYEGSESMNWSYRDIVGSAANAGTWSDGKYLMKIRAYAINGASKTVDIPITIANAPKPAILGSKSYSDASFDILGTTTFKENIAGSEGSVALYIKEISASSYTKHGATKTYEGKENSWKYSDFTGVRLQKTVWGQREILIKAVATAANGASTTVVKGIVIPALGCPTLFGN